MRLAGQQAWQSHLPSLTEYDVPMKDGERVVTLVVDPTYYAAERGTGSVRLGFEAALSRESVGHDLTTKRQNTTRFFEHLKRRATAR